MADLLIRGASLPKDSPNGYQTLLLWYDGEITDREGTTITRAVELPDHGDLIDRAELLKKCPKWGYSPRQIKEADTIIPASPADRSNTSDESPQTQIVADALKHGFYGTMYGEKYAQGVKLVFIEPGKAWASNGDLFFRWGFPGPDMNTYKPEDYGKTWALTEAELIESIQSDPADKEGGE